MECIFDWLRTRIKEESANGFGTNGAFFSYLPTVTAEKIINEAEAKWEADCCEYEYDKVSNLCRSSCNGWLLEGADVWHFNYCPYCGKRIKISEVE